MEGGSPGKAGTPESVDKCSEMPGRIWNCAHRGQGSKGRSAKPLGERIQRTDISAAAGWTARVGTQVSTSEVLCKHLQLPMKIPEQPCVRIESHIPI
jgi:hypothetical protein